MIIDVTASGMKDIVTGILEATSVPPAHYATLRADSFEVAGTNNCMHIERRPPFDGKGDWVILHDDKGLLTHEGEWCKDDFLKDFIDRDSGYIAATRFTFRQAMAIVAVLNGGATFDHVDC